ncbi:MAG: F0F1 ATP synthase subunit B [Actinomycetota bacterium]
MLNLLVLAVEEGEKAEETVNPVIPNPYDVFWAAIFFITLWVLMKYVLLPPIVRAMEARSAAIEGDKDAADAATEALGSTRRDYEASLAAARAEASEILARARASADEQRAAMQAEADAEIAELRRAAQTEIDEARSQALSGMRSDVSALAVGAAQVVLGRDLDAAGQQSAIDQALAAD